MSHSVVIFINKNAANINDLFLNEDWCLTELFHRVYNITVRNQNLDWLVKVHPEKKYATREITRLGKLKNIDGIPKVLAVGLSNKLNYIILSRANGMDLYEYIKKYGKMEELQIRAIASQLLTIIRQVHRKGIVHRDIKPENVIYDDKKNKVVLIDFEGKQTDEYRSPEQVTGGAVTNKTDIWAVGILCYYLARGNTPYHTPREILKGKLKFSKKWSENFKDFLSCLLEREIKYRYSTREALEHVWLTK